MHHWKITLDTTIHTGHFLISYDDSEKVDGDIGDLYDDLNDGDNDVGMGHGPIGDGCYLKVHINLARHFSAAPRLDLETTLANTFYQFFVPPLACKDMFQKIR